jgi:hypothetical protein
MSYERWILDLTFLQLVQPNDVRRKSSLKTGLFLKLDRRMIHGEEQPNMVVTQTMRLLCGQLFAIFFEGWLAQSFNLLLSTTLNAQSRVALNHGYRSNRYIPCRAKVIKRK